MSIDQISARRLRALSTLDAMPGPLRECVHEFGMPIVQACLQAGVSQPNRIRQLVSEIWNGARQQGQTGGPRQGVDWLLGQSVGQLSWGTLIRFLTSNSLVIVPLSPTAKMIEASMNTVSGFDMRVTKQEKHRLRLMAALTAGMYESMLK